MGGVPPGSSDRSGWALYVASSGNFGQKRESSSKPLAAGDQYSNWWSLYHVTAAAAAAAQLNTEVPAELVVKTFLLYP